MKLSKLFITLNTTIIVTGASQYPFFAQQNQVLAQSKSSPGIWKRNADSINGDKETLRLYDDYHYSSELETTTRPGGVYGSCATFKYRTTTGRYAMETNGNNGGKITFQPQNLVEQAYAACGTYFTTPTSSPKESRYKQNTYIVDSFSLENNNHTLVLKQIGGNVNTAAQGIYQKANP